MGADFSRADQAVFSRKAQGHGARLGHRAFSDWPVLPQKSKSQIHQFQVRSRHADPALRRKPELEHPFPSTICRWLLRAERAKRTHRFLGRNRTNSKRDRFIKKGTQLYVKEAANYSFGYISKLYLNDRQTVELYCVGRDNKPTIRVLRSINPAESNWT